MCQLDNFLKESFDSAQPDKYYTCQAERSRSPFVAKKLRTLATQHLRTSKKKPQS
jgi:hypothetical protein